MFLQGKRAMITGSTSGIGLAIARALRAEGAEIVLSGFGARLDVIDWPEGSGGGAARGQDDAYGDGQIPSGPRNDLDDDIPF